MGPENPTSLDDLQVKPDYYTVKPGDTLSRIAKNSGFKNWQALATLQEDGFNPNKLTTGQKIRVKEKGVSVDTSQVVAGIDQSISVRRDEARFLRQDQEDARKMIGSDWPSEGTTKKLEFPTNDQIAKMSPSELVNISNTLLQKIQPGGKFSFENLDPESFRVLQAIYKNNKGIIPPDSESGKELAYGLADSIIQELGAEYKGINGEPKLQKAFAEIVRKAKSPQDLPKGIKEIAGDYRTFILSRPNQYESPNADEKPNGLNERGSLLWDCIRHIGMDPHTFEDQRIQKTPEGVKITAPGTATEKMDNTLWSAYNKFREGKFSMTANKELGDALAEYSNRNGKDYILRGISDILLGKIKSGVVTPSDDLLASFRRENVKSNFFTFRAQELPEEIKPEGIRLLSEYAKSSDPEKIYQVTAERALYGGTMHSVISSIMIALGGEYEKYGEMLGKRINKGDLAGTTTRV